MKTLYLDCSMGAAGDMLAAALWELLPDREGALRALNDAGIPGVRFEAEPSRKCGILGTHMRVIVNGLEERPDGHSHEHDHHHHADLGSISELISGLRLPPRVKKHARAVYGLIAEAESHVHGCAVEQVHFHEVGALDAVADVAAVCLMMELLSPGEVLASPVHVGSGTVRCAHGILPVPAPAAAYLLRGIPIWSGSVAGELCTPTGAALLRRFVTRFGPMPLMRAEAIGCGMGTKDFPVANCLRAFLGESGAQDTDEMLELSTNVDDMTAEALGFAMERIFEAGAAEVYTVPIGMKKSRPGTLLRAICRPQARDAVVRAIFRHTSTLGVRQTRTERFVLRRSVETYETSLGPVRVKRAEGWGVRREKPEYEDLARIARERDVPLSEARGQIEKELTEHGTRDD